MRSQTPVNGGGGGMMSGGPGGLAAPMPSTVYGPMGPNTSYMRAGMIGSR